MFLGHPTISWRSRDIVDIFSISDIGAEGLCHCCSTHRYRNIGGRFPASVKSSAPHGRPPRPQGGFPHWKIEGNRLKKAIPIYSSVASLTWKKIRFPCLEKTIQKSICHIQKGLFASGNKGPKNAIRGLVSVCTKTMAQTFRANICFREDIYDVSRTSWNGRASFFSGQTLGRVRCHARGNPPLQLCHDPIGIRY